MMDVDTDQETFLAPKRKQACKDLVGDNLSYLLVTSYNKSWQSSISQGQLKSAQRETSVIGCLLFGQCWNFQTNT